MLCVSVPQPPLQIWIITSTKKCLGLPIVLHNLIAYYAMQQWPILELSRAMLATSFGGQCW